MNALYTNIYTYNEMAGMREYTKVICFVQEIFYML